VLPPPWQQTILVLSKRVRMPLVALIVSYNNIPLTLLTEKQDAQQE